MSSDEYIRDLEQQVMGLRQQSVKDAAENERLHQWVNDCQAGMYINCVYCGHRYGPSDEVPASMADILKEHVIRCPEHPMSTLAALLREARDWIATELQHTEVELPDAEDLVIRIGKALPE